MLGLIYFVVGLIYVVVTVWLTKLAARMAKRRGIAGWKWGLPVLLGMYLLVFWDWIPTVAMHKYYCAKEAGFTEYITLDEWKAENFGVAEMLAFVTDQKSIKIDNGWRNVINQRFSWKSVKERQYLGIQRTEKSILDMDTNQVLARYVDFDSDIRAIGLRLPRNIRGYKFWLNKPYCEGEVRSQNMLFNDYLSKVEQLGGS
jgi:hypothetical protein